MLELFWLLYSVEIHVEERATLDIRTSSIRAFETLEEVVRAPMARKDVVTLGLVYPGVPLLTPSL